MTAIWDEAFLKQRERDTREDALEVQSDADWKTAEMLLERAMSDSVGGCLDCPLPACRRALRCVGNKPICMPRCVVEYEPGVEQEMFEQFYAEIQEERHDAAAEGRAPDVERVMTHRVHVEQESEAADESAPTPACDEAERSSRPVVEARRSAPSQPAPQPQLHKPEPPAAVPVMPAAKAPPPEPELRSPPDVEERVNRIWAEYEASPEAFSARRRGPRIRLL